MQVYLDNAATTAQHSYVTEAMIEAMTYTYANPGALHSFGHEAEKKIRHARKVIAGAIGCRTDNTYFVSGGTEADNWAIFSTALKNRHKKRHLITTQVEHPAVLNCFKYLENKGFEVSYLPVDERCVIDLEMLKAEIREDTSLISIMHVNNEVGSIFPIDEVFEIAERRGIKLHSDCVQSFGKIPLPKAHMITVSGHKIHGPKGIGVLGVLPHVKLREALFGGGQEFGLRSGTENTPAILGFAKAVEGIDYVENEKIKTLRSVIRDRVSKSIRNIVINTPQNSIGNILNISVPGTKSEVIIHKLESKGIYISAGSACSSKKSEASHVLKAMGRNNQEIEGALRISLSGYNTREEIDYFCTELEKAVLEFRKIRKR